MKKKTKDKLWSQFSELRDAKWWVLVIITLLLIVLGILAALDVIIICVSNNVESYTVAKHLEYHIEEQAMRSRIIEERLDVLEKTTQKGERGLQGEQGEQGEKGANGLNGLNGKNGEDGADGIDGKNGLSPIPRCNVAKNREEYSYNNIDWFIKYTENYDTIDCGR